ncbi:hypothetical protein L1987_70004 [Smallanthus sonchifolius]|uniref:Uncharacterized protein n=1 Tax=Smallanthus sonchifolius TaxID=185202 RepID=A0ACB9B7W4_9ASTR|nr:hypothetical protein L1987_70004 [Smallanthus sonchifolius]
MGDAVFDKAPDEEEAEDIEETEEELDEEEAHVITRDDDLDIFINLSRKHNEQIPVDCSCFGCLLHFVDDDDDVVLLLFILCVWVGVLGLVVVGWVVVLVLYL